jgi:N-acetylmuramoyl-L-alanine amidase
MKVVNHRLQGPDGLPVNFVATDNMGGTIRPLYLIIHYTAGSSVESAVNTFKNRDAKVSAHLTVGRQGELVQMVPFNRRAWHAGKSRWGELEGLNGFSIGIELVNAGKLQRQGGQWTSWFGRTYPDDEVLEATHRHESTPAGWHTFPGVQIEAAIEVGQALQSRYDFVDILGHDDISPGRKVDPGPAFPMISFASRVLGRAD